MKKLMVMMLTVFLVFTYTPLVQAGVACEIGTPDGAGDFCYSVNDDLTVTITDYTGFGTVLVIPGTVDGKIVTVIGKEAFYNNNLTEVTIPGSVTSIGTEAFRNNKLTSVTILGSVTSMGDSVFYSNLLTSVTIEDGVETIGASAFIWNDLTSVTIPGSVTSIGASAFRKNSGHNPGKCDVHRGLCLFL